MRPLTQSQGLSLWESSPEGGERAYTCEPSPLPSLLGGHHPPKGRGYKGSATRPAWVEFAHTVREAVTPHMAAALYGITFDRGGFAFCPFHGEKTPSFHITKDSRSFHCFGCGVSPDVIDLTMRMEDLDFTGALRRLNEVFSLGLPMDGEEITYQQQREMQRKQAERMRADRAEKTARAEWDALWDAAVTELADCDRALCDLRVRHPKGAPIDEATAKTLAELIGRRAYAVYQYESVPDENTFLNTRRTDLLNTT